jgi:hypothetical protein
MSLRCPNRIQCVVGDILELRAAQLLQGSAPDLGLLLRRDLFRQLVPTPVALDELSNQLVRVYRSLV